MRPTCHISLRGCLSAAALGALFTFITLRLTLGSAGITPPLTIPAGLLSYVLLKALTKLTPNAAPFTAQENAVAQTMATSCFKIVGYAGYGSYLTALSYPIYLQLGGTPKGQPGYDADAVIDPELHRVYPYLLLIAFGGIFALLSLRQLLIIKWRLPFPSGAASGSMINSLHGSISTAAAGGGSAAADDTHVHTCSLPDVDTTTAATPLCDPEHGDGSSSSSTGSDSSSSSSSAARLASRKVKVLAYTALGSFLFDAFKWLFQGSAPGCGFSSWPTFGLAAAQWTWRFDFMQQYIGSGFLVPHIVAWSMLLGAVISWGIMWPLLAAREGDWYPAGLSFSDMRGLAGYKIFLSVALLLGEGAFIMVKAALLGFHHLRSRQPQRHKQAAHGQKQHSRLLSPVHENNSDSSSGRSCKAVVDMQQQQGVQPCSSSSTSCSLHHSVGAAAGTDVRLRVTPAAAAAAAGPHSPHQQQRQSLEQQQQQWQRQRQSLEQQQHNQHLGQQSKNMQDVAAVDAPVALADHPGHAEGGCAAGVAVVKDGLEQGSSRGGIRHRCAAPGLPAKVQTAEANAAGGVAGATFHEAAHERRVREAVFLSDAIPGWWGPAGYCVLAALGTAFIPLVYPPARWYMVLVAFLSGPPIALANGFGMGLTDVDNSANYATVAMFLFAAWSAATGGNGIVAGCVLSGVLMVFSVSAAVLLSDLRTGYMTLTPPTSMLVAQILGAAFGVLFSPLAFALFWSTGQVGIPDGQYPAPFASVTRGMAAIGVQGVEALPRHCGTLSLVFFVAAFGICTLRDWVLPVRFARFVPSPMGIAFPFFIPASNALDFWLGSMIVTIWEWKSPASAAQFAPLAGAGLLVGDGLWAIPSAILSIANVSPPMCMKFE